MTCDQGPLQLRDHGVVEAQDPRPDVVTLGQRGEQVFPDFLFDSPLAVPGGAQFADGAGQMIRCGHHSTLRLLRACTSEGRAIRSIARPLALVYCSTTVACSSPGFQVIVPCSNVDFLPPSGVSTSSLVG